MSLKAAVSVFCLTVSDFLTFCLQSFEFLMMIFIE